MRPSTAFGQPAEREAVGKCIAMPSEINRCRFVQYLTQCICLGHQLFKHHEVSAYIALHYRLRAHTKSSS